MPARSQAMSHRYLYNWLWTHSPYQYIVQRRHVPATTQINSTIYQSFLWCQQVATPQNISPSRTGYSIYDPQRVLNFSNMGIRGFGIYKFQTKFELKNSKIIQF